MKEEIIRFLRVADASQNKPTTLDTESRSVDVVISTDTPIDEYDYRTDQILPTIIVPEGIELPKNAQVPLIDSHDRSTTQNQIGSVRDMRVEEDALIGRAHYASDDKSERVFSLVREGHLTDYSIGARVVRSTVLGDGEEGKWHGRTYKGPAKIIHRSRIMEVSSVPIGADENAKNRADGSDKENKQTEEVHHMSKEEKIEAPVDENIERAEVKAEAVEVKVEESPVERSDADVARQERERISELTGIAREAKVEDEALNSWISEEVSVDSARKQAYKLMIERNKEMNLNTPEISVKEDVVDKLNRAVEDGIAIKAGMDVDRKSGAEDLAGYSMVEIAREYLRRNNKDFRGSNMEVIGRALSSSDYPILCGNIAHKSILNGFESLSESYENWCDTSGSVSDFKTHTSARGSEFDDLELVGESEEYKYGSRDEQKEEYQVKKYGKLFSISREALINDDLGELTSTASKMGESAKRLLGDLAYETLTANALMGDGNALFDAAHANVGSAAAIGFASYDEADYLMGVQKDIKGKRRLNIDPSYFVAPRALKGAAEVFFRTERYADADTAATRSNTHFDAVQRVYDSRLDDDSATAWYVLGPKGKTVKMFFLNGQKTPFFERQDMFKVDGATWKVRIEAVAKAMLWQGMVKNAGA